LSLARPGRAFRPVRTGPQPADWSTSQPDAVECRIDDDDVRVRIDRWPARGPIARRAGDRAGRRAELRSWRGLRLRDRTARCQSGGPADASGGRQDAAPRQPAVRAALDHGAFSLLSLIDREFGLGESRPQPAVSGL